MRQSVSTVCIPTLPEWHFSLPAHIFRSTGRRSFRPVPSKTNIPSLPIISTTPQRSALSRARLSPPCCPRYSLLTTGRTSRSKPISPLAAAAGNVLSMTAWAVSRRLWVRRPLPQAALHARSLPWRCPANRCSAAMPCLEAPANIRSKATCEAASITTVCRLAQHIRSIPTSVPLPA